MQRMTFINCVPLRRLVSPPLFAAVLVMAIGVAHGDDAVTQSYVQQAVTGDLFEIKSGEVAQDQATDPAVKKFAQMMVVDHTKTSEKMKGAIAAAGIDVLIPQELDAEYAETLQALRDAPAGQFDALYVKSQKEAHQAALELHRAYSAGGMVPGLKELATETVRIVEHHLMEARQLSAQ